jgi:predicted metal-dependent phosphotriesterase family hydrolase
MSIELINENLIGKVQTVLGIIDPKEMGITITHEHLLVDEANLHQEPEDPDLK